MKHKTKEERKMIFERIKSMRIEEELKVLGNGKSVVLVYRGY